MILARCRSCYDRFCPGGAQEYLGIFVGTDGRKPLTLSTNPNFGWRADGGHDYAFNLDVRYRPRTNVSLSVSPAYSYSRVAAQYVASFADPSATAFYGRRTVFGELTQRTVSMDTRLNVTFTPTLSLEMFAQPFVSTGEYANYREFARPRSLEKTPFGPDRLTALPNAAGRDTAYAIDADRDPATAALTFRNPDFNFRSLRGSAVLRWEYRPGSTLFFVWQQQRSASEAFGDFALSRDAGAIFREHPDNVFVIKATYWLGR